MEANNTRSDTTIDSLERLQALQAENILLLEENRKLTETVDWMHDTIWRLIRTLRPRS